MEKPALTDFKQVSAEIESKGVYRDCAVCSGSTGDVVTLSQQLWILRTKDKGLGFGNPVLGIHTEGHTE